MRTAQSRAIPESPTVEITRMPGGKVQFSFEVPCGADERYVGAEWPIGQSVWGLWERDVVEVFVQAREGEGYYEFQVSPLGQHFELRVFEPRARVDRDPRTGLTVGAALGDGSWRGWIAVDESLLDPNLVGNAFAILGSPDARSYWSLFAPPHSPPDFHQPGHFRSLL